jgi:2,4-dienoyl-CoA reductase-like NADH-dependent reductase (Old Yellow Enzyme family)
MSLLFSPLKLRSVEFANRVFVSPMCQYSSDDGMPNEWHVVHLGSRAVGGAALVFTEASAVTPEGRITPWDAGIWSQAHARAWKRSVDFIHAQGALAGMQIAHAGRKASCDKPWNGGKSLRPRQEGYWQTLGPSAVAFGDFEVPRAMTPAEIAQAVEDFRASAGFALAAGFDVAEIHGAHGYLIHEFLSPLSNRRTDEFGGSLENRMRFPLAVVKAVRDAWPAGKPVFLRVSASDWFEGGWDLAQTIEFAKRAKALGVDLIDCSSGGNIAEQKIVLGPGYQVAFAQAIKREAGIPVGAVGLITDAVQAEHILATGQADAVLLARALLRDPYWPHHAAKQLGATLAWPDQYKRADAGPLGK